MGVFFNSNASIVYKIINTLGWIAGIGCTAMICLSFVKIMTGDEQDQQRYWKRIKNGIIALILIISATQISNLVSRYFSPNINGETSIGNFRQHRYALADQGIASDMKDKNNRKMIIIEDQVYVCTSTGKKLDLNKDLVGWWEVYVDVYKLYSDCQGATAGAFADDQYYYLQSGSNSSDGFDDGSQDYWRGAVFSVRSVEQIGKTIPNIKSYAGDSGFEGFLKKYSAKVPEFTEENNPYSGSSANLNPTSEELDNWYAEQATDEDKQKIDEHSNTVKTDFWNH